MLKEKKLIIFDMDGTLIDSAPSLAEAVNFTLKSLNKEPITLQKAREYIGNGAQTLVKRALLGKKEFREDEIDENEFNKAIEIFLDYYSKNLNSKTKLYPNVLKTLDELKKRGYTLALATNKPHQFVKEMIDHFKISNYLNYYIGAGVVKNKKPYPDMLLKCCKECGYESKNTVMVGDSLNDIEAAKKANMDIIALSYGYNGGIDLNALNPTILCNSFDEILNYLL